MKVVGRIFGAFRVLVEVVEEDAGEERRLACRRVLFVCDMGFSGSLTFEIGESLLSKLSPSVIVVNVRESFEAFAGLQSIFLVDEYN